ncbi:MAG: sel1 repeat family protein [Gammaproteobacteria bacterium]|nr:sel1 repeat family protein [Gammaproteobacteria bacterium]
MKISLFRIITFTRLSGYACITAILLAPGIARSVDDLPTSIDYTMYKLATEMNDSAAQYFIGRKYYIGTEIKKDKAEAAKWFARAVKKNHTKALYMLGKMYMNGDGIPKNVGKAGELLTKAADKGHADAQFEIANYYFYGYGNNKDVKLAVTYYKKAAEDRHIGAQFQLGKILYAGIGVDIDKQEGKKWLETASDNGSSEALAFLNTDSLLTKPAKTKTPKRQNKEKNNKKSKPKNTNAIISKINQEIKQAENGNVDTQYTIGIRYLNGEDVNKNPSTAVMWIRKAAEQDHAGAQHQLGIMYRDGIGVPKSEGEAVKWLRLASSWGISKAQRDLDALLRKQLLTSEGDFSANPELSKPEAQYALGLMYIDGKDVDKDVNTAAQWFLKAARQDHLEAQYRLGEMYKNGVGVKSNSQEAKLWLSKAANGGLDKASDVLQSILKAEQKRILDSEVKKLQSSSIYPLLDQAKQGDIDAKYKVGLMFLEGDNVPKDIYEGIRWLQSAANNNHMRSQMTLGNIYFSGAYNVEIDYLVAAKWFRQAAKNGDAEAQYQLGNLHDKGLGVKKNKAKAKIWFKLAAKQGHIRARTQLGSCREC